MKQDMTEIEGDPLVLIVEGDNGKGKTYIFANGTMKYQHYALLACDLVRHVANAFGVHESSVWEQVDKERFRPTTEIKTLFRQSQ